MESGDQIENSQPGLKKEEGGGGGGKMFTGTRGGGWRKLDAYGSLRLEQFPVVSAVTLEQRV